MKERKYEQKNNKNNSHRFSGNDADYDAYDDRDKLIVARIKSFVIRYLAYNLSIKGERERWQSK